MEKLLEILSALKPGVDFSTATRLVDDGLLNSLDIIQLVSELNDEYDIEITARELIPENFNDAAAILRLVERLEDE